MKIKNLTKAVSRIKKAILRRERIILYGDADLDGVTAVLIADEAIKSLGGKVAEYYFPEREKEGYGITRKALKHLKEYAPGLLITFDLGISNFEEIPLARELGFNVLVVDHHKILEKLPKADIIVDPKQPGETYPFKEFAACGLSLQLAKALLGKKMSDTLYQSMVELAAMGTIADMMVREQDNVQIIQEGLDALPYSWRPGIRAFLESDIFGADASLEQKVQQMIGILNVRDTKNRRPGAFRLLSCPSLSKARRMVDDFVKKQEFRREQINRAADEVRMRIFHKKSDPVIFEGDREFEYMLLGALASIISQETQRPAFLYTKNNATLLGSVRAPLGYDTVKAMQSCSEFLDTYGGHPQASGFQTAADKEKDLRACLIQYFQNHK